MRRSTDDGILTTHVGALQRPAKLSQALAKQGQWAPEVVDQLRAGVADVVRRQESSGTSPTCGRRWRTSPTGRRSRRSWRPPAARSGWPTSTTATATT